MDPRASIALAHVDLSGPGLEIGPSYAPLVPKGSAREIETVDHATREKLVRKYQSHDLPQDKLDAIEEVDHLWTGGSLVDAVGKRDHFQYIVAAHVIEHSVDLIGFLQDCEALLRADGRLALVVPDKRFCFDLFKPLTSLGGVLDAHLRPTTFHPPGALVDHIAYDCEVGELEAWGAGQTGELRAQHLDLADVEGRVRIGTDQQTYLDAHRWIFTPASLSLLIDDLGELGYHSMCEVGSAPTSGFEFYLTLAKSRRPTSTASRIERLLRIQAEMNEWPRDSATIAASALERDKQDLEHTIRALEEELRRSQKYAEELTSSTSWRATAPLRWVTSRARR